MPAESLSSTIAHWILENYTLKSEGTITTRQVVKCLRDAGVVDENCSPSSVDSAVSKTLTSLTGKKAKKIQRKGIPTTQEFRNVQRLPILGDQPIVDNWFSDNLGHTSATATSFRKSQASEYVVELSSSTAGHKEITLSNGRIINIKVRGADINLIHLPARISITYASADELLRLLNLLSNMTLCSEIENRSPSCSTFISAQSMKSLSCRVCRNLVSQKKIREVTEITNHAESVLLQKIYAVGSEFGEFVEDQLRRNTKSHNTEYATSTMNTLLRLCIRDQRAYNDLRSSGMIGPIPCPKTLSNYKNRVKQKSGINHDFLLWMSDEADALAVPRDARIGGLIVDEMSIQPDLAVHKCADTQQYVGLTDLDPTLNNINSDQSELASHALQFIFNGYNGYSFPAAHYPVKGVSSEELNHLTQTLILALEEHGFTVEYVSLDGAAANRRLVELNTKFNVKGKGFTTRNLSNRRRSVTWIMDPKHVIKKIRNSVESSRIFDGKRVITTSNGSVIVWDYFLRLYEWSNIESISICKKLTNEHMYPNDRLKMRNHLAEEVLDEEMLQNFKIYQRSLRDGSHLTPVIEFLEHTSKLVRIFNDQNVIKSRSDPRVSQLQEIREYFKTFTAQPQKLSFTKPCLKDIECCLGGTLELTDIILKRGQSVNLATLNSDIVENHFCQIRTLYNGANNNPNYFSYMFMNNSVVITQPKSLPGKRNANIYISPPAKKIKR